MSWLIIKQIKTNKTYPSKEGFFSDKIMNNKPIVMKFGGTSVSSKKTVLTIADVVKREKNTTPIIVVSALSGVTDLLLFLATQPPKEKKHLIQEFRKKHEDLIETIWEEKSQQKELKEYIAKTIKELQKVLRAKPTNGLTDKILSYGEILSSYIIAQSLRKKGLQTKQVIATELIVTDENFGSSEFLPEETKEKTQKKLLPLLHKGVIPIVTGFIGATEKGQTTTLGRGGSDYTAAIIGFCLDASEIQIWTDVNGIYTADPKMVKKARHIKKISYAEASEMAFFGAKVLHPRTIRPAVKANIPVRVLNTFNPKHSGTTILKDSKNIHQIAAVSYKKNVTMVNLNSTEMLFAKGFLVRIFQAFAKHNISIDLVSVSEVNVSVTLNNDELLHYATEELKKFTTVTVTNNNAIVSLIGKGITSSPETTKKIFELLDKKNIMIKMLSMGATNSNVSLVISNDVLEHAVNVFHNSLIVGGKN